MQVSPEQKVAGGNVSLTQDIKHPGLAIISAQPAPYRLHFLKRVARELTEVRLFSVFTHEGGDNAWTVAPPAEIKPVFFGPGEDARNQDKLKYAWREWRRGGRVIRWMRQTGITAMLMVGYNDPGRLRILRWCGRHAIPVLLWGDSNIRGDLASGVKAVIKRRVLKRVLGRCNAVLACGSLGKQYFQKYGARGEQIFYSPVEPDYQALEKLDDEVVKATLARFGLRPDRRRIVFSGRLVRVKRPDLVIDAFVKVAEQR